MAKTAIEWTDYSWNPVTGCTKVSAGCAHCYGARMAKRLAGRCGYPEAPHEFDVTLHPERLRDPLHWKKPRRVFVCSMGDLFHPDVPADFIAQVYGIMALCEQHTFIVLTKRPERIVPVLYGSEDEGGYLGGGDYFPNIWHMTTTENQEAADRRIPELLKLRYASRGWPVLGISVEPMLGPVRLFGFASSTWGVIGKTIDWVICGGETGPGARPMLEEWPRSLLSQCQDADVPFFFKSWGAWVHQYDEPGTGNPIYECVGKEKSGRLLDGREWNEYPEVQHA